MSFGPPPPKTRYGDQDFVKEDFDPQQSQNSAPYQTQAYPPAAPFTPPMSPPMNHQSPYNQPLPPVAGVAQPNIASKVTEEDRLFIKSWRNDCFYYRVLPFTLASGGALFWFNKVKGRPNKVVHFAFLPIPCYLLGIMSYTGNLKKRLAETSMNTPFIQGLRQMTRTQPSAVFGEFSSDKTMQDLSISDSFDKNLSDSGSWGAESSRSQPPLAAAYNRPSAYGNSQYPSYDSGLNQGGQQFGMDASKPAASYDELRARNRGLIPPK